MSGSLFCTPLSSAFLVEERGAFCYTVSRKNTVGEDLPHTEADCVAALMKLYQEKTQASRVHPVSS